MFITILSALAPVFALILLGFSCARRGVLPDHAFEVLNRFVISLALPVLTFHIIAKMDASDLAQPTMLLAVLGGALGIYGMAFTIERALGQSAAHANIAALASSYSNTAFIGLPIATILLGPAALGPVALAGALYAAVVFTTGVLVGELSAERPGGKLARLRPALRAVSSNPIILSALAGITWCAFGLPLSGPADTMLATLGAATPACALIAIGLFIGRRNPPAARAVVARNVALKLVVHPLLTLGLVLLLPPMPPLWGKVAVLMAAMPTGTGSFVLSGGAGQWAMQTSARTIVLTTILAAATLVVFGWIVLILPL